MPEPLEVPRDPAREGIESLVRLLVPDAVDDEDRDPPSRFALRRGRPASIFGLGRGGPLQGRVFRADDPEVVFRVDFEEPPASRSTTSGPESSRRVEGPIACRAQTECASVPGSTSIRRYFPGGAAESPIRNASSATSIVQNPSVECWASRTGRAVTAASQPVSFQPEIPRNLNGVVRNPTQREKRESGGQGMFRSPAIVPAGSHTSPASADG